MIADDPLSPPGLYLAIGLAALVIAVVITLFLLIKASRQAIEQEFSRTHLAHRASDADARDLFRDTDEVRHDSARRQRHDLIEAYAEQGLSQSSVSFRISILAAGFGFTIICLGVILTIVTNSLASGVLSVSSGAIIDAVSLLFFQQDRRRQASMFEFFEKLREDRKLEEAIRILGSMQSGHARTRTEAAIVLNFAGIADVPQNIQRVVEEPDVHSPEVPMSRRPPDNGLSSTTGPSTETE